MDTKEKNSQLNLPEGHQAVMPYLILKETDAFFEFIEKVFGAKQKFKMMNKEGTGVVHAENIISGRNLMYSSPNPFPEQPSGLCISVNDVDETYEKALKAGATSIVEPCDPEWGRFAGIKDQFGNTWWITSTPKDKKEQPAVKPYLSPKDAPGLLEFLKKVFHAEEKVRRLDANSEKILHAEILVSGNIIMVSSGSEENCHEGAVSVAVPRADLDEVYKRALAEGSTSLAEPFDFPWGRFCGWKDPFGQTWWVINEQPEIIDNVTPFFSVKGCEEFLEFAKKAFNGEEKMKRLNPEGKVYHAEFTIFGTLIMCSEGSEATGYNKTGVSVEVEDVDEVYNKAIAAGAVSKNKPTDASWGKFCRFEDSFGNPWMIKEKPKKEKANILCPYVAVKDAPAFLEFLKKVLNADEKVRRLKDDGNTIIHAEAVISGEIIMCSEGSEELGYRNGGIFVYVVDVDGTHKVALAEGSTETMAPCDMGGGRGSGIKDPFGNTFWFGSTKKI